MTIHKKHEDNLHIQLRTKILDQYGNPIIGAIEYDPGSGYGKRIKDPALGLVEPFYCKDGSIELDGHNFDDTNHDPDKVEAIKTLINLNVNRSQPEYADILAKHVDNHRRDSAVRQQAVWADTTKDNVDQATTLATADKVFKASGRIDDGQLVIIDLDTGTVKPVKDSPINPTLQHHFEKREDNARQEDERNRRLQSR